MAANDPAVVLLSVSYGAAPGTIMERQGVTNAAVTPGTAPTDPLNSLNTLGDDVRPDSAPQSFPVRVKQLVSNTSQERIFRLKFQKLARDGSDVAKTVNILQNFKVWSDRLNPSPNCTLYYRVKTVYGQPFSNQEAVTWGSGIFSGYATIPITTPTICNLTIIGLTDPASNQLLDQEGEYTDYQSIVLDVATNQTSGGTQTISVSYDEIS